MGDTSKLKNDKCGITGTSHLQGRSLKNKRCRGTKEEKKACKTEQRESTRIIGGTPAQQFPWAVQLVDKSFNLVKLPFCSGTIIASQWVITSAHCIFKSAVEIEVLLGNPFALADSRADTVGVSEIFSHTDFVDNSRSYMNDVALLKLNREIDLNKYTPACLPEANLNFVGKMATSLGFGLDQIDLTQPQTALAGLSLQEVTLPVTDKTTCNKVYSGEPFNTKIMNGQLCAGGVVGVGVCQGDDGGPLTLQMGDDNQHNLIGVSSFVNGCGQDGVPAVFADISYFRDWIECKMKENGGAKFVA